MLQRLRNLSYTKRNGGHDLRNAPQGTSENRKFSAAKWNCDQCTGRKVFLQNHDCSRGKGIFLFFSASRRGLRPTQPHIQWITEALFPVANLPQREAGHSPPNSAEEKNTWGLPPLPGTSSWRGTS